MGSFSIRELVNAASRLATLEELLAWLRTLPPPAQIVEVLAQDEYTLDVVVDVDGNSHLVFDTT